ncbi:hypothetical protein Tco_1354999 [Tanacetum coccineum]|uniref:Uncharacterized protein n=1 Tax=Tanacetum coccineum TaxID=301880 RepID=A0ABQ4X734_9ASTR
MYNQMSRDTGEGTGVDSAIVCAEQIILSPEREESRDSHLSAAVRVQGLHLMECSVREITSSGAGRGYLRIMMSIDGDDESPVARASSRLSARVGANANSLSRTAVVRLVCGLLRDVVRSAAEAIVLIVFFERYVRAIDEKLLAKVDKASAYRRRMGHGDRAQDISMAVRGGVGGGLGVGLVVGGAISRVRPEGDYEAFDASLYRLGTIEKILVIVFLVLCKACLREVLRRTPRIAVVGAVRRCEMPRYRNDSGEEWPSRRRRGAGEWDWWCWTGGYNGCEPF